MPLGLKLLYIGTYLYWKTCSVHTMKRLDVKIVCLAQRPLQLSCTICCS